MRSGVRWPVLHVGPIFLRFPDLSPAKCSKWPLAWIDWWRCLKGGFERQGQLNGILGINWIDTSGNGNGPHALPQSALLHAASLVEKIVRPGQRKASVSIRSRVSILPVDPIHRVGLEVATDGSVNCRKETPFANLSEQPEALQLIFHWILQRGEA